MSYILDAIRKSEQQRQRDVGPALPTVQIISHAETQPSWLLYGVIAATLICAGILIGWLRPWQAGTAVPDVKLVAAMPHDAPLPQSTPSLSPLPKPEMPEEIAPRLPERQPAATLPVVRNEVKNRKPDVPAPTRQAAPVRVVQPIAAGKGLPKPDSVPGVTQAMAPSMEKSVSPVAEAAIDVGAGETTQEQKVVSMAELPPAIQQEIPKMSISGYAYSNVPKERTVGINDRLLQEGDTLAPGLRLEQINPDSLVFSYKKYRFRHGLQ